ncbi:hypothetical protein [Vibrio jasicida]|uniref:Uncharacterized protein n=1 Tax=Vibrio jasicida TaxID=766224 RepID=A0ABW7JF17_9VIBR
MDTTTRGAALTRLTPYKVGVFLKCWHHSPFDDEQSVFYVGHQMAKPMPSKWAYP